MYRITMRYVETLDHEEVTSLLGLTEDVSEETVLAILNGGDPTDLDLEVARQAREARDTDLAASLAETIDVDWTAETFDA